MFVRSVINCPLVSVGGRPPWSTPPENVPVATSGDTTFPVTPSVLPVPCRNFVRAPSR